jgi:hypothetical protein
MSTFESKSDWERYWNGPDMVRFRAINQSLYQVPLLYSWATVSVEGALGEGVMHEGLQVATGDSGTGDMV